jgi:hypothetical protein
MSSSDEAVPVEGTSKGARTKRLKLEEIIVSMNYKYKGNPIPSKFSSTVMNITDTLVGHIDMDQFVQDAFSPDAALRVKVIANFGLVHVSTLSCSVQCLEFILTAAQS